ncbi:HAD-IIIC family phosphatase [Burkholderia metallica]|uniref:HAD-IIIC family phosphatase n=1 Tax=Burkholderia metallica TaxID=488729 RepID=UPI001CF4C660|nr:HAD-IIIC family phosphatase [Burkholderia metallica]MCA7998057.1 HAD-IIIC family phosphatase [Burkholderia metallica]
MANESYADSAVGLDHDATREKIELTPDEIRARYQDVIYDLSNSLRHAEESLRQKTLDLEYANYKQVRISTNGLHGFDFHKLSRTASDPLKLTFFGPCAILPIVDSAIRHGHNVSHISMTVDEDRNTHFSPPLSDIDHESADANVVTLPLRAVMAGGSVKFCGFGNEIFWPRLKSEQDVREYFDECVQYIKDFIESIPEILNGKPTFFLSFWEPRRNFLGNLLPRYSLQNPQFFVESLNREMEKVVRTYSNSYILDVNDVLNSMGRFRIQDDYARELSHASSLFDGGFEDDDKRIQKSTPVTHIYDVDGQPDVFGHCVLKVIEENIAIIKNRDPIKLIIMDLDDSLWRGVLADADRSEFERVDFWPMGLAEALLTFKARGGLLAICSKNDEHLAKAEFDRVWRGRLTLDDFVSIKINFEPKSQNITEILEETNLLPGSALFIDDNPREIDEVTAAIPDIRTLSREHFDWRRAILFSPDTQVANISKESIQRTESIKAKIVRDEQKKKMSREEWLKSLDIKQRYSVVRSSTDSDYNRAFELLNKTNQFNTNGRRWTAEEMNALFAEGGFIFCSFLRDKSADNGMIGLHLVKGNEILQSILSCRVFGLLSEYASMNVLSTYLLGRHALIRANYSATGKNFYCEKYYLNCGFTEAGQYLELTSAILHPDTVISDTTTIAFPE